MYHPLGDLFKVERKHTLFLLKDKGSSHLEVRGETAEREV